MQTIVKEFHHVVLALPEKWNPSEWLCQIQFISESPVCWDIRIYEHLEKGELEKRPHPSWGFALGCDHLAELETVKRAKENVTDSHIIPMCKLSNVVFNDTWRPLIVAGTSKIITFLKRCIRSKLNTHFGLDEWIWDGSEKKHITFVTTHRVLLGEKTKLHFLVIFE